MSLSSIMGEFVLTFVDSSQHLQLDASATYALGLFDSGVDGYKFLCVNVTFFFQVQKPKHFMGC
jgi:hypothetical protein